MFRVQADEGPADEPARSRRDAGIDQGAPDHVARNDQVTPVDGKHDACRKPPQHADEACEQQGRLKQPDAEIGRELREVARVFMNALVGVDADLSGLRQEEDASRRQPFGDEIAREGRAHLHAQHLVEPCLGDVQREQRPRDLRKHAELRQKIRQIPPRQRVVKGLVPRVELDLPIGGRGDHPDKTDAKPEKDRSAARGAQNLKHHRCLRDEGAETRLNGFGPFRLLRRLFRHLARSLFAIPGSCRRMAARRNGRRHTIPPQFLYVPTCGRRRVVIGPERKTPGSPWTRSISSCPK